jgi:hypothetical protein
MQKKSKAFATLAIVLFIICLPMEAVLFDRTCPVSIDAPASSAPVAGLGNPPLGNEPPTAGHSFLMLLLGGFSIMAGLGAIGWLANPLAVFAFLLLRRGEFFRARAASLAALVLAVASLHATNIFYLAGDEGGVCRSSAIAALPGFWLWVASLLALFVATLVGSAKHLP